MINYFLYFLSSFFLHYVQNVFPTPTIPLFICYHISVPAVHHVFHDLKPRLNVNYFQKLTILSVNTRDHSTPNLPFLSRTFHHKVITIYNIMYYDI